MEAELLALLEPAIGPTAHWGGAPQNAPRPFVVLTRVSAPRAYTNEGQDALVIARVQADAVGGTYGEAKRAARAVIAELSGRRLAGRISAVFVAGERDLPAVEVPGEAGTFVTSVDLFVHHTE